MFREQRSSCSVDQRAAPGGTCGFATSALSLPSSGDGSRLRRRVARCIRQPRMCAASEDDSPSKPVAATAHLSEEEIAAKRSAARLVREEAERMRNLAERAKLDAEAASLDASRTKLELEKLKLAKEEAKLRKRQAESTSAVGAAPAAPSLESLPATTPPTPQTGATDTKEPSSADQEKRKLVEAISTKAGKDFEVTVTLEVPAISEEDIQELKNHVFGMDTFFVTEIERAPLLDRAVFRGNLRTEPRAAFESLLNELNKRELKDRIRLFLMEDPADGRKPVVVALPAQADLKKPGIASVIAANLIIGFSVITVLGYSVGVLDLSPELLQQLADGDEALAQGIFVIPTGILGIVAAHEIGHRIMAALRNIKVDLPYLIPSLQIGCFGTITPLLSFPRDRSALFDFAVAGPLVGLGSSLAALIYGFSLTAQGVVEPWFPRVATDLFQSSLLVGSMAKTMLPAELLSQSSLSLHPIAIVGYTGLLINALNLIPIGRLDGGRIVQSLFGRVTASAISISAILLSVISSSVGNSPLLLWWAGLSLLLQRDSEIPCQDELTEPNNTRAAIGLAVLIVMLITLVPFPDGLQQVVDFTGTQI